MRCTVYFVEMSEAERGALNSGGTWDCPIGRAYMAARDGNYSTSEARALLKPAAIMDAKDAESVWVRLQNLETAWATVLEPLTRFPRSMDLGDVIHWADGRAEYVAAVGFKPAALAFTETGGVILPQGEPSYVLRHVRNGHLYWNTEKGWVPRAHATTYSEAERAGLAFKGEGPIMGAWWLADHAL